MYATAHVCRAPFIAHNPRSSNVGLVVLREAVLLRHGPRPPPHPALHRLPRLPAQPGQRRQLLHGSRRPRRRRRPTSGVGVGGVGGGRRGPPPGPAPHPPRRAHDAQEALPEAPDPDGVRAAADGGPPRRGAGGRPVRALRAADAARARRVRGAGAPRLRRRAALQLHRERRGRQDVHLLLGPAGHARRLRRRGPQAAVRLRDEGGRRHVPPAGRAGGDAAAGAAGGHVLRRGPAVHGPGVAAVHARHGVRALLGPRPVDHRLRHGQEEGQRCGGRDHGELAERGGQGKEQGEHLPQDVRLQERRGQGFPGGHHRRAPAQGGHQVGAHAGALQRHLRRSPAFQRGELIDSYVEDRPVNLQSQTASLNGSLSRNPAVSHAYHTFG
uniref:Uncharacterized protein n=1 Tax=Triticum urartu TaxID=4572 RepID=A0A8R7V2Q5_TRIUA